METTMGRVLTKVIVENLGDLIEVDRGSRSPGDVRRITADEALVDTGATTLALPTRLIGQLGLAKVYEKRAKSTHGVGPVSVYEAVRLTLEGRFCSVDVMEVADDVPVLIGQIPLEMLDLVVDVQGRRLIGNPAHGGEHVLELFGWPEPNVGHVGNVSHKVRASCR
jgi:predicted aspartyl protease